MFKIFFLVAALVLTLQPATYASIHGAIDGSQNVAVYQTSKKTVYFSQTSALDIVKTARPDGTNTMILHIMYQGIGAAKAPLLDTAYVIVDGVRYPVQKIVQQSYYATKVARNKTFADFLVTDDVLDKIQKYQQYCWFEFIRQNKKANTIKMSSNEQEEVRLIAKLTYNDFEAFDNGDIKPVTASK